VVPILHTSSESNLTSTFNKINGLLLPGGDMNLTNISSPYMTAMLHLWKLSVEANQNGDYFPVWGTCLGFQEIAVAAAESPDVLLVGQFDSWNLPLTLEFTV
jgi:gamma-glutamyl hydrolase